MSADYYNLNSQKFFQETVNVSMKEQYSRFLPKVTDSGSILDAGCGSGRDTKAFGDLGYKVTAFDGSERMAMLASKYTGLCVKKMLFEDIAWVDRFDGIWACASLLHLNKNDFISVGKLLNRALKKNCPIYMSFKYGNQEYTKDGRYFQCYDEAQLSEHLNKIGFSQSRDIWVSFDVRPHRREERWVNAIVIK